MIADVGVDWITATGKPNHHANDLWRLGTALLGEESERGNQRVTRRRGGYTGHLSGDLFLGSNEDGVMLQAQGGLANSVYSRLRTACDNVSRLDLQVTDEDRRNHRQVINQHWRTAEQMAPKLKGDPDVTLISSRREGITVYLGDRSSDRFGRIYSKALQKREPEYENLLRYEIELKGTQGLFALHQLHAVSNPQLVIASTVWQFLWDRGVVCPWDTDKLGAIRRMPTVPSDLDRTLKWLSEDVTAAVVRVVESEKAIDLAGRWKHILSRFPMETDAQNAD